MKRKVFIASHDAGGAQILSFWCQRERSRFDFYFHLKGPAKEVFLREWGEYLEDTQEILNAFSENDFVLTGTSLESSLEREVIQVAQKKNIPCISYLDHWDLYRERFGTDETWKGALPDEIWVGDEIAQKKALEEGFPKEKLTLKKNPYFEHLKTFKEQRSHFSEAKKRRILYICEPVSRKLKTVFGENYHLEYQDELKIMQHFLHDIVFFQEKIETITLRLHPSESRNRYETSLQLYWKKLPLAYSESSCLLDDIVEHDTILGVESMGLVVALYLNKRVYSCIPGKNWEISLPHKEINRISEFKEIF